MPGMAIACSACEPPQLTPGRNQPKAADCSDARNGLAIKGPYPRCGGFEPSRLDGRSLEMVGRGKQRQAQSAAKQPLPLLSGFSPHDRGVSIRLVRDHFPATCQAGQDSGFGTALREKHEALTFISLSSAPIRAIHDYAFTIVDHLRSGMLVSRSRAVSPATGRRQLN